jgi:hypothetical protein
LEQFLREFLYGDGLFTVVVGSPTNPGNVRFYQTIPEELPEDKDVYFGPAMRKSRGTEKTDVDGTRVLWVDADDPQKPLATLPPSAIVQSGHGYHLYWFLNDPLTDTSTIEQLNQLLAKDVPTADPACWNCNRILRVPGTTNNKEPEKPVKVVLQKLSPEITYDILDIRVLEKLNKQDRHRIRTGDSRGFHSRSERDWAAVTALVDAGATDGLIERLFALQPCGDKVRSGAPANYLPHTIEKARSRPAAASNGGGRVRGEEDVRETILEGTDGYYVPLRRGLKRVSTFTIQPKLLLDGSTFSAEDAIVGTVTVPGYTWPDITFSRSAFTSVTKIDKECPIAAWQWLGRDEEVRLLLPFLLNKLQESGLPRVVASPTQGLHILGGVPYFLGDKEVIAPDQYWNGFEGPLAWLPSQREHPEMRLQPSLTEVEAKRLRDCLPRLNEPEVIWTMLGWYAAASLKPWLETQGYRFPVLNVAGTKGSGKTTLIQRIFMPLFGQGVPKSYDAGTTRFVTLAILGSTNAIPIAFSEFRYESAEKFLRYILLSYDTGHDPRGRGDQTTVDYPLQAPFSVDGEDIIQDPAARERIVVAHLHPRVIEEGSEAYNAFNQLRWEIPKGFGGQFLQHILRRLVAGNLRGLLDESRDAVFGTHPGRLPDRVRNNHVVVYFGARLFCEAIGLDAPDPGFLGRSINTVFNTTAGRSRTLVDDMVEDIVNSCTQPNGSFQWNVLDGCMFFQLASAHSWWVSVRRRQGRGALERDAIKSQLAEAPYYAGAKVFDGTPMLGVSLAKAQEAGLDIPDHVNKRTIRVDF